MAKKTQKTGFTGQDLVYYNALMKVRNELTEQMRICADESLNCTDREKRGVTTHMADNDSSRNEMGLQMLTENGNIVSLIDDALERLSNGEYGICMDCGERISEARLMAKPYAIFCIKCKTRHEEMMKDR